MTAKMSDERKKFFLYLFNTAMEGGVQTWAEVEEYHWLLKDEFNFEDGEDIDGFYAILSTPEGDWGVNDAYIAETDQVDPITEDQLLRVDLDVIKRGWEMYLSKVMYAVKTEDPPAACSNPYFRQAAVQYLTNMEDGDSDTITADLVVQFGLFGEHLYS